MKKALKIGLTMLMALVLCLGLSVTAFAGNSFYDEDGDLWTYDQYSDTWIITDDEGGIGWIDDSGFGYIDPYDDIYVYDYDDYDDYYDYHDYSTRYYLTLRGSGTYSYGDYISLDVDTNVSMSDISWSYDTKYLYHMGYGDFEVINVPSSSKSLTITAKSSYYGVSDSCSVTIRGGSKVSASLDKNKLDLQMGGSGKLYASASGGNPSYKYSWSTDNRNVATVTNNNSDSATVSAVGAGTARIRVEVQDRNGNTSTASCTVTVAPGYTVSGVNLSSHSTTMNTFSSYGLTANVTDSRANYTVSWTSSNTNVVLVSGSGNSVTLSSQGTPGTAAVTATVRDNNSGKLYTDTCTVTVQGTTTTPVAPPANGISVVVRGMPVQWTDATPYVDANGRTMVPLRAVGSALGLSVEWDGTAKEAVFSNGTSTIYFPINSNVARTNTGATIQMDTAAVIKDGRTYAPVCYLAEFFGYTVSWDGSTKTVGIN